MAGRARYSRQTWTRVPAWRTGRSAASEPPRCASDWPSPGRMVSLTPLGTRAMRQRMLAEGREAGPVGELGNASPAGVLRTGAEHYTPATAAEWIRIWPGAP